MPTPAEGPQAKTRKMPRDWLWTPLHIIGTAPLGLLGWIFYAVSTLCEAVSDTLSDIQSAWLRRVRLWSGRTPDGETPAMLAAEEARRQKFLADMRASLGEWKRINSEDSDDD